MKREQSADERRDVRCAFEFAASAARCKRMVQAGGPVDRKPRAVSQMAVSDRPPFEVLFFYFYFDGLFRAPELIFENTRTRKNVGKKIKRRRVRMRENHRHRYCAEIQYQTETKSVGSQVGIEAKCRHDLEKKERNKKMHVQNNKISRNSCIEQKLDLDKKK